MKQFASSFRSRALLVLMLVGNSAALAQIAEQTGSSAVVSAIREGLRGANRVSACTWHEMALTKNKASQSNRAKARNQISQGVDNAEPLMLRARADVFRQGLYGYAVNKNRALKLYERNTKSPEAGWNAALMRFINIQGNLDPLNSKIIISTLKKSGATSSNARGVYGAYAHYMAGKIYESGQLGSVDHLKAFEHYRISARNSYIPGAYHYLKYLSSSLSKLPESEQIIILQEIRMMVNRWKGQSAEIMFLAGDLYSSGWLPDNDGFLAQYNWRLAMRMGGFSEIKDIETRAGARVKQMTAKDEEKLKEAVEAGMKNVSTVRHNLEFANLCVE